MMLYLHSERSIAKLRTENCGMFQVHKGKTSTDHYNQFITFLGSSNLYSKIINVRGSINISSPVAYSYTVGVRIIQN